MSDQRPVLVVRHVSWEGPLLAADVRPGRERLTCRGEHGAPRRRLSRVSIRERGGSLAAAHEAPDCGHELIRAVGELLALCGQHAGASVVV